MKKKIGFIVFSLSVSFAQGQILKSIGIKSGLSISTQIWNISGLRIKSEYKTGYSGGLSFDFFQNKYWSLCSDLLYIQKGSKTIFITPAGNEWTVVDGKFNFISFSPQFKGKFEMKRFFPYLFIGPRIEYCRDEIFSNIIYGFNYGVGIEFRNNSIGASLDFQHQYDLTSFNNDGGDYTIFNKCFLINAGWSNG